jgi:hypothetical protein
VLPVARDLDELLTAIRARRDELQTTHAILDDLAGLQAGYVSKLLANPPIKSLGQISLGALLGALGIALHICEDPEQLARVRSRLAKRKYRPPVLVADEHAVSFKLSRAHLRRISALAAKARMDKIPARRRSAIARKAARAGWSTPRLVEITGAEKSPGRDRG